MGWVCKEKPADVKSFIQELLTCSSEASSDIVVGLKKVGKNYYCAVERTIQATKAKSVIAFVVLTDKSSDKNDIYDFWYKIVSEFSLPDEIDCPLSILNMLTENEDENSLYWRKQCREKAMKMAGVVMPKANQFVVFAQPLTFSNGVSEEVFQAVPSGKSALNFRSHKHGFLCKISKLKGRDFKVFDTIPSSVS
ncbi:DUF6927 domain-containing protein [Aeromonas sp. 23P]|uniref:DUF6927 domain-containing protein n=1 Tax=Aeromonas sp. 23P TaxID=3452716 RepID=UPI003F7AAFC4|nr:hypothetical protein [Aeromonas veronii]